MIDPMKDWLKENNPTLKERLAGRLVVASVSGGKDSAALSLWLTEQGIEHRRVHAVTGWDHEWTMEYLRGPLTQKLGPIEEVTWKNGGMVDLIRRKGSFPSRLRRFCTEELKILPLQKYMKGLQDDHGETINAVGLRAGESKARAKLGEWEWSDGFDCEVWRPLIQWSEQDVIEMHTRHGLAPNPLYLRGLKRVGCWPCIHSSKSEIKIMAELSPERVDVIRGLEEEITGRAYAADPSKGDGNRRTFFHGKLSRESFPAPIDDVVAWSQTVHGGKQFPLFEEEQPEGCVRWGLCEAGTGGDDK
jgi:3'-phosphoadenosine 5'-phosphosulfate sulfotransferase (PAPS reductase)/FAD synthetase